VTESTSAVYFIQNISCISDSDGVLTAKPSVSTDNGLMTQGLNRGWSRTAWLAINAVVVGRQHFDDVDRLLAVGGPSMLTGDTSPRPSSPESHSGGVTRPLGLISRRCVRVSAV
jgi:hypothetical protein